LHEIKRILLRVANAVNKINGVMHRRVTEEGEL